MACYKWLIDTWKNIGKDRCSQNGVVDVGTQQDNQQYKVRMTIRIYGGSILVK